ncbi:MAG: hypothetical protein WCL04_07325 [Verrucomicrobiota bacterium]
MKPKPATARLLALLLAAPLLVFVVAPVSAQPTVAGEDVLVIYLTFHDVPAGLGYTQLARMFGANEVLIEPDVLANGPTFTVNLEHVSKGEPLVDWRAALEQLEHITFEELPDHVLHFAHVSPKGGIPLPEMKTVRIIWCAQAVPAEALLRRMRVWSGKEIRSDPAALAGLAPVMLDAGERPLTAREMFVAACSALLNAGVVLDEQPDGSYRARLAAAGSAVPPKP